MRGADDADENGSPGEALLPQRRHRERAVLNSGAWRELRRSSITRFVATVNSHARADSGGCSNTSGFFQSLNNDSCTTYWADCLSPFVRRIMYRISAWLCSS
jgi:hypothetical protein